MAASKKKNGCPNIKFYECAETISQFEPVKLWLFKNFKKVCCISLIVNLLYMFLLINNNYYFKKSFVINNFKYIVNNA